MTPTRRPTPAIAALAVALDNHAQAQRREADPGVETASTWNLNVLAAGFSDQGARRFTRQLNDATRALLPAVEKS